jgi:hypothetical protein
MDNISKHISYKEAIYSETAKRLFIDNNPNKKQLVSMKTLAEKIFEPLREHFKIPIFISSFFRSKELNYKIGGSANSQHCLGEAMDIDADVLNNSITNLDIFNYIKDNLIFDQLIAEDVKEDGSVNWVHCSYSKNNRNQILIGKKDILDNMYYEKYNS